MSPVARRHTSHTVRALVVAAVGVVLALGVAAGIAILASRGTVEVRLGDDTFRAGDAESAARQVAESGPLLYADTAGRDRDIVLQHLGHDPNEGWLAFAARPPGAPRQCVIEWQDDEEVFRLLDAGDVTEDCDGREFPADGGRLPQYPVSTEDGDLDIRLREP